LILPWLGQQYTVAAPVHCQSPLPTRDRRLEFDACTALWWNEVDAIRMVGTTDEPQGQFPLSGRVVEYKELIQALHMSEPLCYTRKLCI
jgi:hypothetical protein